jgi:hypothetical protein
MDWINRAQDRDQWWALVNTVINLRTYWEILESVSNWWFLKKDSAPWS